ncbi:MAG: MDR family MFS transporter [Bauldia sp.]
MDQPDPPANRPIHAGPPHPPLAEAEVKRIVFGVILSILLGALDQTIVATALPTIGRDLHDFQNLGWVVTAYLLASTAATPLYGKLSDIHGRQPLLMIAIGLFVAGSIAAALADSMMLLILARGLQGLGGGGLMSLGQTIIADVVPPRERGRFQAYFAAVFMASSLGGPVIGGFLAERLHWTLIFWINLPLAAVATAVTVRSLAKLPRHERPHRLDILGAALLAGAAIALNLALTWGGSTFAWTSPEILGLLGASAALWALLVWRLLTAPEPFVPLAVLHDRVVRYGTLCIFFGFGSLVGLSIYLPIYYEAVEHLSADMSGIALMVITGGSVIGANVSGRLMMRVKHYKRSGLIGLGGGAVAMAVLALLPAGTPFAVAETLLALAGIGIGTVFPLTTVTVQNAVEPHQIGTATGMLNLARSLGGAIVVAVFGAIFLAESGRGGKALSALLAPGAAAGADFHGAFRLIFAASAVTLAASVVALMQVEERPLRGRAPPAAPAKQGH